MAEDAFVNFWWIAQLLQTLLKNQVEMFSVVNFVLSEKCLGFKGLDCNQDLKPNQNFFPYGREEVASVGPLTHWGQPDAVFSVMCTKSE